MSSHVLEVEDLTKRFGGLVAVDGVSLHVDQGETYGLLGPNGAGKSTTISIIAGLLQANSGTIRIGGDVMTTRATSLRSRIGLVPQDLAVYPDLTCRENLRFFARLYGMGRADATRRIDEVLEVIGLTDRADDRADEFSGGMKRRLNIGIGLLHRPTLLILDEPTVGVDPQSRNAILDSVEQLSGAGLSVLYTTHYMEEAERLCHRIGIIDHGRLMAEGTRRELVTSVGEQDRIHITATGPLDQAIDALDRIDGVAETTITESGFTLLATDAAQVVARAIETADANDLDVTSVEITQPDLEAVFLHLTGRALRD
ncbi:MAG: ABC transporter ATP-binding protein [Acidimicrobiales bacterium]